MPFTWNPSGVPGIAGAGGAFTADGIVASDYVYAKQPAGDAVGVPFSPEFVFKITGFTGTAMQPQGFGSSYGLYFRIVETDEIVPGGSIALGGTVSLWADPTNDDGTLSATLVNQLAFSNPAGVADDILLGSGPIISASFRAPPGGPVSKVWLTSFAPAPGSSAFFLSPLGNHVQLEMSNTNTSTSRQFPLNADGSHTTLVNEAIGAIDVTVPEPGSMVVLGTALIGLVPLWRRFGRSRRLS